MKIGEVIDEILTTETPNKRSATQVMHKLYFRVIKSEIGHIDIDKFTRLEYFSWMKCFKGRHAINRDTYNDYTKFVNIISNYAYQQRYTTHLIKFPMTDGERDAAGRVFTNKELKAIWECLNEAMRPQFILAFECFMRLRETLHLTWDRVDLDKRVITLRKQDVKTGTKCGKGRVIPLSDNAVFYLKRLQSVATTKWVFPNPLKNNYIDSNKKAWINVKRNANISGRARWHDLRHTSLSIAVMEKKVPLPHLSKVAGLSIRTLERVYLHAEVEQLRHVAKALNILKIA